MHAGICRQIGAGTMADERIAVREQAVERLLVEIAPIALAQHRIVGRESECLQRAQLPFGRTGDLARRIQVLDAHEPFAASVARQQPASQRCHQRAEVERAGRRGSETPAVGEGRG